MTREYKGGRNCDGAPASRVTTGEGRLPVTKELGCTLFVEGRLSFSWESGMGYFSAVAPVSLPLRPHPLGQMLPSQAEETSYLCISARSERENSDFIDLRQALVEQSTLHHKIPLLPSVSPCSSNKEMNSPGLMRPVVERFLRPSHPIKGGNRRKERQATKARLPIKKARENSKSNCNLRVDNSSGYIAFYFRSIRQWEILGKGTIQRPYSYATDSIGSFMNPRGGIFLQDRKLSQRQGKESLLLEEERLLSELEEWGE
ncbi:hypothetical protein Sjap_017792 [Stephania japonica]|uniref:Uncharacterized protein n=1 Tax=Stephania japonica TaxID=461633 RepID=A0AAP0NIN4_9MAGN